MAKRNIVHIYKIHDSMKEYICFYCNGWAQSKDHIPPISYPDNYEENDRIIVRCCLLCNSFLGNRLYLTFLSRYDYLLIRYYKRFEKLLSMPFWAKEEIDDLTGKLRRNILNAIKKKKYIEDKIIFIKNRISILQGYD